MKRIFSPIFPLLVALLTPLHGSVTLDLGGGQASGDITTAITAGTLQLSPNNLEISSGSLRVIDGSSLLNTISRSEPIIGPLLGATTVTGGQLLLTPSSGGVVYSSVNGGTLNLGTSTGSLSRGVINPGTAGVVQFGSNYLSPALSLSTGVIGGIPLISTTPLVLQPTVAPSLNLTQSGPLQLSINTGVILNPTAYTGILNLGTPAITLGSGTLTTVTSNLRLVASSGTLVLNGATSIPNLYGATIVSGAPLTTFTGGSVITGSALIRTGAGTLTLASSNTLDVASANTLTVLSGSSLFSGFILGPENTFTANGTPVPEPGSVLLLAGGLGTLFLRRWRRPGGAVTASGPDRASAGTAL